MLRQSLGCKVFVGRWHFCKEKEAGQDVWCRPDKVSSNSAGRAAVNLPVIVVCYRANMVRLLYLSSLSHQMQAAWEPPWMRWLSTAKADSEGTDGWRLSADCKPGRRLWAVYLCLLHRHHFLYALLPNPSSIQAPALSLFIIHFFSFLFCLSLLCKTLACPPTSHLLGWVQGNNREPFLCSVISFFLVTVRSELG